MHESLRPNRKTEKQIHLSESIQLKTFGDDKFRNDDRKSKIQINRKRVNSKYGLSLYNITKVQIKPWSKNSFPEFDYDAIKKPDQIRLNFSAIQTQDDKKQQKLSRDKPVKLRRYINTEQDKIQPNQMLLRSSQTQVNQDKLGLIKKLLQHFNIKPIEKAYYSNLISNFSSSEQKQQVRRIRCITTTNKILPKKQIKKQRISQYAAKGSKSNKVLNMHGYEAQQYLQNQITLKATGISQFIKVHNQKKSKLKDNASFSQQSFHSHMAKIKKQSHRRSTLTKYYRPPETTMQAVCQPKVVKIDKNLDNPINSKVNKYRQFLFAINFANNIYRELDIQIYQENFKVYIGFGNNNNLIKSIMKKRFWFEITKKKEEANFVWTQIKQQSVFANQLLITRQSNNWSSLPRKVKTQVFKQQNSFQLQMQSSINLQTQQASDQSIPVNNDSQTKKSSKIKQKIQLKYYRSLQNSIQTLPQTKLFTPKQVKKYHQILSETASKKKLLFSDRLRFLKNISIQNQSTFTKQIVHNHLPLNGLLGNKKAMFYILQEYYRIIRKNVFDVVPLTFHIKTGFLDQSYKAFISIFMQNRVSRCQNYWIIKPGQFTNRGNGIMCTNRLEDIRNRINQLKNKNQAKDRSLILQRYITNPLLYNGRKFDIRTYMLVTSNNDKIRAYWYHDGYIRTSSYMWTLQEITDTDIHLTNDAIQKHTADYGKYQPGNKLTYSQLQRYLDTLPPKNGINYNFMQSVYPKLKSIASDAIKASFYFLDPHRHANNFQIFGLDFMVDDDFKPWLIEINTNPCLQMSCPVLQRIIPCMVENAFRIGLDTIFPPPVNFSSTHKYTIPQNALHYNKFQLIFDQQNDTQDLIQEYKNNKIVQKIDSYQQDRQLYEEQGTELNLQDL